MKTEKQKLALISIGSVLATWLIFRLFFYLATFGYENGKLVKYEPIGDSYCKFWIIPAHYASFKVSFKSDYTGQLTLIDKRGNQLRNTDYNVIVDGKEVGTSFRAPGKREVEIKIRGNSRAVSGRTFVRVQGGGPLITHYYFRHHSNPFFYYLAFLITAFLFVVVLWYVFLQRLFYPRFRNLNKTIVIPNQAPVILRFKGKRQVVLTNVPCRQGLWDKVIKGPIAYKVVPSLTAPIVMKPTFKGKKILVVTDASKYTCMPNPIQMARPATIEDLTNKQKFTIN